MSVLLIIALLLGAPEKGDAMEETDNVAIATMLLMDGFLERADAVLAEVDTSSEDLDQKQYWRLRGIVAMKLGKQADAARYLDNAIEFGDIEPRTHLLLAQAHAAAKAPEAALAAIRRAPEGTRAFPERYLLEARILYDLDRKPVAFHALDRGFAEHPDSAQLERQRMLLLVDLGLYQEAVDASRSFLKRAEIRPKDHIALAGALVKAGEIDEAVLLLEAAALEFPYHDDLRAQLSKAYLDADRPLIAAEILRPLAWTHPEKAHFAAGLYQRARKGDAALRMNALVADQKKKLRQRLSLLIESSQYEQAAALTSRLSRLGLLEDQQIVYALAYAFFQTGDHARARPLVKQLTDERLFERGVELLRIMEVCGETGRCN